MKLFQDTMKNIKCSSLHPVMKKSKAMLEAMASGCVVVAVNENIEEIITHGVSGYYLIITYLI